MTLNERLAAILERHPQLRPTLTDGRQLHYRSEQGSHPVPWRWFVNGHADPLQQEEYAHALIFRAMVEGLPSDALIMPPTPFGKSYWTVHVDKDLHGDGPTAFEAVLAYWENPESSPAQEKP